MSSVWIVPSVLRRLRLTDGELEQHIQDCGRLLQKAHAEGDAAAAREWAARQAEAIAQRSAEYVALLEKERGLDPSKGTHA